MFIIKASLILTESFIILYSDKYVFRFCFRAVEAVFNFFVESYPKLQVYLTLFCLEVQNIRYE